MRRRFGSGWLRLILEALKTLGLILLVVLFAVAVFWITMEDLEECQKVHSLGYCLRHMGHD